MPKKKSKSVSFDAMVKFFMQHYNIPTKKDIDKLMARMDRLEKLIKASNTTGRGRRKTNGTSSRRKAGVAAYENVLQVIKKFKNVTPDKLIMVTIIPAINTPIAEARRICLNLIPRR